MKNTLHTDDERRFHTLDTAAHLLAVHPDTLSRAIAAGRLKAVNVGNGTAPRWRIHPDELRAWLESTDGGRRD